MIRASLLVVFFFVTLSQCWAQTTSRETVNQFANWYSASSMIKMSQRFSLFLDGQYRFAQNFETNMAQLRVGGDFSLSKAVAFMPLGYVYVWNYQYGKQPVSVVNNEHRIFQQVVFKHRLHSFSVQHRLRTEERFIQAHHIGSAGELVDDGYVNKQFRVRYRVQFTFPLTKQKDPRATLLDPKTVYLQGYDEIFVSRGQSVTYNEIDQNRVFVGVGYQMTQGFTFQTGFFYQLFIKANGAQQENNIGIGTWLTYNLDFTKS